MALKKIYLGDSSNKKAIDNEISHWRRLGSHPNVVQFFASDMITEGGAQHCLILCELCTGGHLLDLLEKNGGVLKEAQIVYIMKDIVAGLKHMHS